MQAQFTLDKSLAKNLLIFLVSLGFTLGLVMDILQNKLLKELFNILNTIFLKVLKLLGLWGVFLITVGEILLLSVLRLNQNCLFWMSSSLNFILKCLLCNIKLLISWCLVILTLTVTIMVALLKMVKSLFLLQICLRVDNRD